MIWVLIFNLSNIEMNKVRCQQQQLQQRPQQHRLSGVGESVERTCYISADRTRYGNEYNEM